MAQVPLLQFNLFNRQMPKPSSTALTNVYLRPSFCSDSIAIKVVDITIEGALEGLGALTEEHMREWGVLGHGCNLIDFHPVVCRLKLS